VGQVAEVVGVGRMKSLGYISISLAALFFLFASGTSWFFRDGLGPDSVESIGVVAWSRFWKDFYPVLFFCVPVFLFGVWCILRKKADPPT
jgi:hypothetical protein